MLGKGRFLRCVDTEAGVRCQRAIFAGRGVELGAWSCGNSPLVPKKRTAKKAGR